MMTKPQVYSQFTVTSGCLCYGALHNIWHGATRPVQQFPTSMAQHAGGTVKAQIQQFNVTAKNGTWNAFQLVAKGTGSVCAWFVSHSDVDPEVEIDKILRVSGSPYEYDSGSQVNNENTAAEAVLVIGRYDWGYYDNRGKEELGIDDEANIENFDTQVFGEGAGLVDFGTAKTEVLQWQKKERHEIDTQPGGIWMFIPRGEYMFGRFGFDESRTAARSFLFFTTNTYFTHTTFVGLDQTLRVEVSDEEKFQRYLREGRNFEGLDSLERLVTLYQWSSHRPAESEYLGPYDSHEHILKTTDLNAIRTRVKANEFTDPFKELCYACLNEIIMSYLEHFIAPASSYDTIVAAATSLFPKRSDSNTVDSCMYSFLMEPYSDPIPGFDHRAVESRVKGFLIPRCEDNSLVRDDKFIAGICACIAYLLSEVLEHSRNCEWRGKLIPVDIRLAVFHDLEVRDLFKYSRVFWKGSDQAFQVTESSHATEPAQAAE
ncbi:hypothetical protein V500_00513 [Pseudogymnoascus sp. VKM F-4518 (FW-2643)]|nr:hypothetical protein V500_00513 [Pseudogymnoascus sp. VKM F-4518 (FW-2643)]